MKKNKINLLILNQYKDLYGGHKIIYVCFLDEEFVFRTLTKKEYKYLINSGLNEMDLEDSICNTTCLYPEEFNFYNCGMAGISNYICPIIKKMSHLEDIKDILNEYEKQKEIDNLELQCMDLIKAFIPEYTYEEMEDWTWEKLIKITVRAKKVAELKGFEWHLKDNSEKYIENINKLNSDNKEFVENLIKNGIDPMIYFEKEMKDSFKKEVIDFPLIGGVHWNNEVILNVIRKQNGKKNIRKL